MDVETVVKRLRGRPARGSCSKSPAAISRLSSRVDPRPDPRRSVKSAIKGDKVGYARITTFTENTANEFADAITKMKAQAHGRLNGFVLDLRNDPGGLLDAAVDVTGEFVDGGVVVTTKGRNSDDDRVYRAPVAGNLIPGAPMVVLINSASASAAEIVAGALQDEHRATVMGTRSFGKGSVQTIIPIEGHGALRLTTALYYTPSGRSIQGHGISPDIIVTLPKNEQVANAVLSHESDLFGALPKTGSLTGRGVAPTNAASAESGSDTGEHPIKPLIIGTGKDAQLDGGMVDYLQRAVRGEAGAHPG